MSKKTISSLAELRAAAASHTLWQEKNIGRAIERLGFVQADPIRAPARAQDLILRVRLKNYTAGELEQRYSKLAIEEDFLVNYGFLPRKAMQLLHPRILRQSHSIERSAPDLCEQILAYVQEHGPVHPRDLEKVFGKQSVDNYWGGKSQASSRALDALHHRGLLRIVRRENGIKVFGPITHSHKQLNPKERAAALLDLVLQIYAPLPLSSLSHLVSLLGYGAGGLKTELRQALEIAKRELPQIKLDGLVYVWPATKIFCLTEVADVARIVAPFDPLVWDRRRFLHLHGWEYKFEAYTPAPRRKLGYYALPIFWRDKAVGWANIKLVAGKMQTELGFVQKPKERAFVAALDDELEAMKIFLAASDAAKIKTLAKISGPYQLPGSVKT